MTIAVCIPSRSLMHSRTMEDVLRNTYKRGPAVKFIFSHGRPQPDAQNYVTEEALKENTDYIWFVDDDMQIPPDVLDEMIDKNAEVVVAHYPCTAHGSDSLHIRNGKFESAGMGCVLVKRSVFDKLEKPYFRSDINYVWENDHLQEYPARTDVERHGGHDVFFSQQLVKAGIVPTIIETKLGQYNVTNNPYRKYGNATHLAIETWNLPE